MGVQFHGKKHYVTLECMFLTRCHEFMFPATKGYLPRRATFAPNRRWPLVAGTTVRLKQYRGEQLNSFKDREILDIMNND